MKGCPIIVFARRDSRRLPGKALLDLGGRPLLGRVLDRLKRVGHEVEIVVATSDRPVDDPIADFAAREGVAIFRGAAADVAGRALACCAAFGANAFVRISGDSPFIDPGIVARVMECFAAKRPDLATNVFPRTYPPGMSVEVISVAALERAATAMTTAEEREHVTLYLYREAKAFRILNLRAERNYGDIRLTVDTPAELERARRIVRSLGPAAASAPLETIVRLACEEPHISGPTRMAVAGDDA